MGIDQTGITINYSLTEFFFLMRISELLGSFILLKQKLTFLIYESKVEEVEWAPKHNIL